MDQERNNSIIDSPKVDTALDVAATFTNLVPVVGGVLASILSGYTIHRKFARVYEVLDQLDGALQAHRDDVNQTYVKSEDFEDIFEKTLEQVGMERHAEKRTMYAKFLLGTLTASAPNYDAQLAFLRLLDELQLAQINVLHIAHRSQGGWASMLAERYLDMSPEQVQEHLDVLFRLGLIGYTQEPNARENQVMYFDNRTEYIYKVTSVGRRFLQFLGVTEYM